MTEQRAKAILYNEWQGFLENNIDYAGVSDAYKLAFNALEQMSAIDDIKAEIEEYKNRQLSLAIGVEDLELGKQTAIEYIEAIIDKHINRKGDK